MRTCASKKFFTIIRIFERDIYIFVVNLSTLKSNLLELLEVPHRIRNFKENKKDMLALR